MSNSSHFLSPFPDLPLGKYRHYKGKEYEVLGLAHHSETEEIMVIYRPLYKASGLWVRPYTMFVENVELNGQQVPRFTLVQPVKQQEE